MQNINLNLFNFIKDLIFYPYVSYLHSFRIASSETLISFEILVFALLTAFISPAIPYYDGFDSDFNLGAFTLTSKYNFFEGKTINGLVFLLCIKHLDYFYFFLFRSELYLSAFQSPAFPIDMSQSELFLHNRFFSFQKFCEFNNLIIEPLFFKDKEWEYYDCESEFSKIKKKAFYYYFPFSQQKQEPFISIFNTLFKHIMQSDKPFLSCLFWSGISNILPIYTHTALSFFASTSTNFFKFEIIHRCFLNKQDKLLVWSSKPLDSIKLETTIYKYLDYKKKLQVKPFSNFFEYCKSSQRDLIAVDKKIVFEEKSISIFNFKLWFDLALKFRWFSVGGFLKLDFGNYVTEIYNFMQFNLLNANVHCSFTYFDNKKHCLYFWLLFDHPSDFVQFKKKKKKLTFILTERFSVENYLLIDHFLKSYMAFYPINEKISGSNVCDYRTASYYIGLYSKDLYILSLLYENILDLQSQFFPTDTLLYTMSVLHLDVISDDYCPFPIAVLRKETGLEIMEDIWLFIRPHVYHKDLTFFLETGK